jgi:hypothetical protein
LPPFGSPPIHLRTAKLSFLPHFIKGENWMELRSVLKLAIGMAVGATALAGVANAAPLAPASSVQLTAQHVQAEPALVSKAEADRMKPQEVRWHHRHWGWHRHWHRRHWR